LNSLRRHHAMCRGAASIKKAGKIKALRGTERTSRSCPTDRGESVPCSPGASLCRAVAGPVKPRAARDRLRRLAALTGQRLPGCLPPSDHGFPCAASLPLDAGGNSSGSVLRHGLRPFCGSTVPATLAPWLMLRNRDDDTPHRATQHQTIFTTMHARAPLVLVGGLQRIRRYGP
jgi:hypothetical protein